MDNYSNDDKKPPKDTQKLTKKANEKKDTNTEKADANNDILSMLEADNLEEIKKEFTLKDKGLTKTEFIKAMLTHLPEERSRKEMTEELIDLFEEIDVNGDGTMEWQEFTNHIIERGMVFKDSNYLDSIKKYVASSVKDNDKHENEIEHIYYFNEIKKVVVMERESKTFKVYDSNTGKCVRRVQGRTGIVICAEFVKDGNETSLVTSADDNTLTIWDDKTFVSKAKISTSEIQMTMRWSDDRILYTGGCDGVIHAYNISERKEILSAEGFTPLKKAKDSNGHKGAIMDLLIIKNLKTLASAGMDGDIFLWNSDTLEFKKILKGHKKGVFALEWAPKSNILFSAGLDHNIFIWNPYVHKRIFMLKGHSHSILGIKFLPEYQLISGDISGIFRIWDIRTFTAVQIFNCGLNDINSFTVTNQPKRIIVAYKKLVFFDYEEPKNFHLTDDMATLQVLYNSVMFSFITCHPKSIKIWDATDGNLVNVHLNLSSRELTCMCLDTRERKLFIGDSKGRVFAINVKNGAIMKTFTKHNNDTSSIVYWADNKRLISSSSWDGTIIVHDDSTSATEGICRSQTKPHKGGVNHLAISEEKETQAKGAYDELMNKNKVLLASCSDDKSVILHNLESSRQEAILASEKGHKSEIKTGIFLTPFNCFVSSDLLGSLCFWAINPSKRKNTLLTKIEYKLDTEYSQSKSISYCIKTMVFDHQNYMFTGDEKGNLCKWDLSRLLSKLKLVGDISEDPQQNEKSTILITEYDSSSVTFETNDVFLPPNGKQKAHDDGITSIIYIDKLDCIVTSSFDCRVFIWNKNLVKIGALLMGGDKKWKLKVDISERKLKQSIEAEEELKMIKDLDKDMEEETKGQE